MANLGNFKFCHCAGGEYGLEDVGIYQSRLVYPTIKQLSVKKFAFVFRLFLTLAEFDKQTYIL